jgi:SprT protein
MDTQLFEEQALAETQRLVRLASAHYISYIPSPTVRFDLRGKTAGMVIHLPTGEAFIRYNRLMLSENGAAFIEQTVPHEVAHLVARQLFGPNIRPHGREWRKVMLFFGANPIRCHNFPVSSTNSRRMRYFHYRCACQVHSISAVRHHRSLTGVTYLCRRCGSPLRWSGSG